MVRAQGRRRLSAPRRLPDAPHALITGTSGAIGGAIARELRRRRPAARLSLVDRDGTTSSALALELGGATRVTAIDLGRMDELPQLVSDAEEALGPVDVLVNCAGIMDVRSVTGMPWERAQALLEVDLLAPLRLQHRCAAGMVARGQGWIVNVSSMAGRVPLKGCAYYGAAKAGLAMASEVARAELAPRGVSVLTVYPGPVASGLERGARSQFPPSLIARAIPTGDAAELARRILDALDRGSARVIYPSAYSVGRVPFAGAVALALGPSPSA